MSIRLLMSLALADIAAPRDTSVQNVLLTSARLLKSTSSKNLRVCLQPQLPKLMQVFSDDQLKSRESSDIAKVSIKCFAVKDKKLN
ncbi:hypothetical protein QQP08_026630 [Theobroma cacao]|nr:hypothetical protein QQP08_026630 [Theobroma cacao]